MHGGRWGLVVYLAGVGRILGGAAWAAEDACLLLVDAGDDSARAGLVPLGVEVAAIPGALPIKVSCGPDGGQAGVAVDAPEGTWDPSNLGEVVFEAAPVNP